MSATAVALLGGCLSGCIIGAEKPGFDKALLVGPVTPATPAANDIPYLRQAKTCETAPDDSAIHGPLDSATAAQNKLLRNACIESAQAAIKSSYIEYRRRIARDVGVTDEALDVASNAGSTAGAATKNVAHSVLSGLGGVLGNARTTFDSDSLYKQSLSAIFKQMDADVDAVGAEISQSETLEYVSYTMTQARLDLLRYYEAGLITHALDTLDATAGAAKQSCSAAQSDSKAAAAQNAPVAQAAEKVAQTQAPAGATSPTAGGSAPTTQDKCAQIDQVAKTAIQLNYTSGPYAKKLETLIFPKKDATPADLTPDAKAFGYIEACLASLNFSTPNPLAFVDSQANPPPASLSPEQQKAQVLACVVKDHPELFPPTPRGG